MTKHVDSSSASPDRPAFQITDGMVEAGIAALLDTYPRFERDEIGGGDVVMEVYRAMLRSGTK